MNFGKDINGLDDNGVIDSRERFGSNILTPPSREPLWKLFFEKFKDPIIRILIFAAVISLMISVVNGEYIETIGIFFAIMLATVISFWFERDANKKFDILNKVNDEVRVKVVRNGNIFEVPKREVVVGDVVVLETGEEVPSDGKIIEAVSLLVNESTLTGEPMVSKTTDPAAFKNEATYPSDMILRGTTVIDGHCTYLTSAVGDSTEFGKVARKSMEQTDEETPLNRQLEKLANFIGLIGFLLAVSTFLALFVKEIISHSSQYRFSDLYLLIAVVAGCVVALSKIWLPLISKRFCNKGSWIKLIVSGLTITVLMLAATYLIGIDPLKIDSWISLDMAGRIIQIFMVAVTLIVVAVPEGLPMSVTLSLALSMRRMLQTNNLVRKMHACETMGATTVICTDKTGTLTQNRMQVADIEMFADRELFAEGIAVNSTAFLDFSDKNKIKTMGNPTEAALLLWLHEQGINYLNIRDRFRIISQLTFSTERKFMATMIRSPRSGKRIVYIKGAPEIIIGRCASVPESIQAHLLRYQNQAKRTLAFACVEVDDDNKEALPYLCKQNLTFMGVVAISDPIRSDVPAAVARCLAAGISVKIVTGDTPGTARQIAREIGILSDEETSGTIIAGADFEKLSDTEVLSLLPTLKVMCRARPTDKQRLVTLLQERGEVVAVTGDGTNDAPALNHAHVGLSMGSGTSVAKEASDITLLDDSFNSIVTAVMWGRSLYQNIRKFLLFQLTINFTALLVVFLGSIFGHEMPLTVTQMLWVNIIMDTFAAAALASLPPNEKVMKSSPRKSEDFIISSGMGLFIVSVGSLFVITMMGLLYLFTDATGTISPYNLSLFFTIFVMLQFWNMFNAKAFGMGESAFKNIRGSKTFLIVSLLILTGQIVIVNFGGPVFRTVPISLCDWMIVIASTSVVFWVGEILRFFMYRKGR